MYSETYSADGGYVTGLDENGGVTRRAITVGGQSMHTMSGVRLTTLLREQERNAVVQEMHARPDRVSDYPAQTVGGKPYPAVQYRGDYGTFIVLFDPATHLPAVIRSRDFDQYYGDSNYDEALSDWRDTAGIKMPGDTLKLTDIGPNITMATGATHNTLIVATDKYLVAFEAPIDDGLTQWVIKAAAEKYPGKPFRYVVLTHHHIDHTGGVRAFAAGGATIVVGKGDGAFWRKVLAAPHGLDPYPVKLTGAPKVIEVDGKWSIKDGGREIDAFTLENPHAHSYLIPYIPDAKLGFVTDIWSPGRGTVTTADPSMVALVRGIEKFGIQPERFAGGHGFVDNYSVLTGVVAKTQASAR
jgi:glyoxylase-like metal-dependent hydrolase (beta-lactamase superfamily II)